MRCGSSDGRLLSLTRSMKGDARVLMSLTVCAGAACDGSEASTGASPSSFVLVMLAVIVAQSLMFGYMIARWNAQDPSRSPSNVASAAAADVGAALEANRGLDLAAHLQTHYGRGPYGVFVVTRDGRVAGNGIGRLPPEVLRSAEAVLAGAGRPACRAAGRAWTGPVVDGSRSTSTANSQGLVVLPPRRGGVLMTLRRWLSWPGTIVLVLGTILAAVVVFAPARRRLKALEHATERLGRGDLQRARARRRRRRDRPRRAGLQPDGARARRARRGPAHVRPAAAADARRRLARAQDAAHVDPRLHRNAADAGDCR